MVIMSLRIFITGRPGIGKTTVFMRVVDRLRSQGYIIGGIVCPEIRGRGGRLGFQIIDLMTNRKGILAHICKETEVAPRIGKYCVNVNDAIEVGVHAINRALQNADVIGIDEVGPMELKVPQLKYTIYEALQSNKPLIAVVHHRVISNLARTFSGVRIYEINYANRNALPQLLASMLLDHLKKKK